jgi:hypothetical protein
MPNIVSSLAEHAKAALGLNLVRFTGGHLCATPPPITTFLQYQDPVCFKFVTALIHLGRGIVDSGCHSVGFRLL